MEDVLTRDMIVSTLGPMDDLKIASILETGATVEEFEEAVAWAEGQDDVMGKDLHRPLSGPVAAVYDLLTAEAELEEAPEA